jgi:hypothetical protein
MMRRARLAAVLTAALCTFGLPVHAATLTSTGGPVRVDDGKGFRTVSTITKVRPGSRISVGKKATAVLHYGNGCAVTLRAGQHVTVAREPTCPISSHKSWRGRSGVSNADGAPDPTLFIVGGAAITAGVIVAITRHRSSGASP